MKKTNTRLKKRQIQTLAFAITIISILRHEKIICNCSALYSATLNTVLMKLKCYYTFYFLSTAWNPTHFKLAHSRCALPIGRLMVLLAHQMI